MRVQRPVTADLPLQSELSAIGRQQQLDGRCIEADAVVQRRHTIALIDAANHHHPHQDVQLVDVLRIPRKERLYRIRLWRLHDQVDPARRDIDAWKLIDDLVHLGEHDAVAKRGGLHDRRRVFGVGTCVEIALAVRLVRADQSHTWRKVNKHSRVELHIGVDGADLQKPIFEQLGYTQTLRSGKTEVDATRDAPLEELQMFGPGDARDQ